MELGWIKRIVYKIAAEVHKSKIEEFEKRILEIEQRQLVILKTIQDNQAKLEKLDDRLYQANMESAAAVGAIKTFIERGIHSNKVLTEGGKKNEHDN